MENLYRNVIGIADTTKKLSFFCESFAKSSIFPNTLFVSSRGQGKTFLAKETGRILANILAKKKIHKPFVEINSSTIRNVDTLVNYVFLPYVFGDKSVTIYLDECHSLKRSVVDMLLTMLHPNNQNKNLINYQGRSFTISFDKVTFILATTEIQKVFPALRNRLEEIQIETYTQKDLAQIIKANLDSTLSISDEILMKLASVSRDTPRTAADSIAKNLMKYVRINHTKEFKEKDFTNLTNVLGIFPLGLSKLEAQILKLISNEPSISLTKLAACTNLTKSALQNLEHLLLRMNLMEIQGRRKITVDGMNYLEKVKGRL